VDGDHFLGAREATHVILDHAEIARFIERGHCRVPRAFERDDAAAVCERVWDRMESKGGIRRSEPASWPAAYDIEEHLDGPEVTRCFSDRLATAIGELLGPDRWTGQRAWGLWPVSFSWCAESALDVPDHGWHVDGNWFRHTVDCPKQGLLVIGLFTDIAPGGGGTVLAEGTHRRAARVLAAHPAGLTHRELFDAVLAQPIGGFHQIEGEAGDVVLAHPFLFHTRGVKRSGAPRILSNTEAPLREPIGWRRPANERTPLEESIARALHESDDIPADAMRCTF